VLKGGGSPPVRVLVIEDKHEVAANIGDYLEACSHQPDFAYDGLGGLHLAVTNEYDVIVLDIGLPGMDGLSLCRRLREDARSSTPILMLTARDTLDDKLAGFDVGADDYLVKPFALKELVARLNALAQRGRRSATTVLSIADLELDPTTREVRRGGRRLEIGPAGFKVLKILLEASPAVVSRQTLAHALWGDDPPSSDALRTQIYDLRRAIDRPFGRPLLHTVYGIGYRLAEQEDG
jgi:DNA-binding response OmpR family regulator